MSDTLKPMPLDSAITVRRWEVDKITGDRKEVITVVGTIDIAGKITFEGNAGRSFEPLLRITRRCAARLVEQSMREAFTEAQHLQETESHD